jgi:hypothetical protein
MMVDDDNLEEEISPPLVDVPKALMLGKVARESKGPGEGFRNRQKAICNINNTYNKLHFR